VTLRRALLCTALGLALPLAAAAAPVEGLKFDDYRTGYEALLGNGDVEDAYRLAQEVNRRYPKDRDWQRRLARVAVWTERPAEAYAAWKGLFQSGVRDLEVVNEVFRLATHFNDAPILIELWHARRGSRDMSEADAEHLAALYERAYRPVDGARHFEQQYRKQGHHWLGLQAARLYARAGRDDDAIRLYRALLESEPANGGWLLTTARLEIRRDRRRAALDLLKAHQSYMADDAFEYWQILGDLAWLFQDDVTAAAAYRRAAIAPAATLIERDRLTYLLMQEDPLQAAAAAVRFHAQGAGATWLLRALEIQVAHEAWPEARATLGRARGKDLNTLLENPRFPLLRAHIMQHFGDTPAAVASMRQALALAPDDDTIQLSALWLFVAANEHDALAAMIAASDADAADPRYWQALAAATQTLGRHAEAQAYYRLLLQQSPNDPLLLLNYADLMQATGQAGLAARLRQQAWRRLQQAKQGDEESYLARTRLELDAQPGDGAALRVRRLRAQSRDMTVTRVRQLDEVLLAWALETAQMDSALAWSRQRYDARRPLPVWARLQLALESEDLETLQALLDAGADRLPASSAHDAALLTGHWPQARQLAFDGALRTPEDDELHQRLVDDNARYGDFIEAGWQQASYSDVDSSAWRLRAEKAVSGNWRLAAEGYEGRQTLTTTAPLAAIPGHTRGSALEAVWSQPQQAWHLGLDSRHALTGWQGWRLGYTRELDTRLQLELLLAARQPSEHSSALQVAGHADRATIGAGWAADRRLHLHAQLGSERYHTQHGAYLGSGTQLTWEAAWHLHGDYPDWNIRAYGNHYRFRADGMPDAATLGLYTAATLAETPDAQRAGLFIPGDNDYYALCGGAGQYLRDGYSRAFRPLADACAIHNREGGDGYSLVAGVVGSLDGEDRLSLIWETSNTSVEAGGRDVRVLSLSYRRYF
jgi:predicted Zn-dependent protease